MRKLCVSLFSLLLFVLPTVSFAGFSMPDPLRGRNPIKVKGAKKRPSESATPPALASAWARLPADSPLLFSLRAVRFPSAARWLQSIAKDLPSRYRTQLTRMFGAGWEKRSPKSLLFSMTKLLGRGQLRGVGLLPLNVLQNIDWRAPTLFAPMYMKKTQAYRHLQQVGVLWPRDVVQAQSWMHLRYMKLLLPARHTPSLLQATGRLVQALGAKVMTLPKTLPGFPNAILLSGNKTIVVLCPRQGWVEVLLTFPPTRRGKWKAQSLAWLASLPARYIRSAKQKTPAWRRFASSRQLLSVYANCDALRWTGTWNRLSQAMARPRKVTKHRRLSLELLRAASTLASLPTVMFDGAFSAFSDLTLSLSFERSIRLEALHSLSPEGRVLYRSKTVATVPIQVKQGAKAPHHLSLSLQRPLRTMLRLSWDALPWQAYHPRAYWFLYQASMRRFSRSFAACGTYCPAAAVVGAEHVVLREFLRENFFQGFPLLAFAPKHLQWVAPQVKPTKAWSLPWAAAVVLPLGAARTLEFELRQRVLSLPESTVKFVKQEEEACVMLGLGIDPVSVFGSCRRASGKKRQRVPHRFDLSLSALGILSQQIAKKRLGLPMPPMSRMPIFRALSSSKVSKGAALSRLSWRTHLFAHARVIRIALGEEHAVAWTRTKPALVGSAHVPQAIVQQSKVTHQAAQCAKIAKAHAYQVAHAITQRRRGYLTPLLRKVTPLLRTRWLPCLRRSPKHLKQAIALEKLYKSFEKAAAASK